MLRVNQFRFSAELLQRNYSDLSSFVSHLTSARVANQLGALDNQWRQHEAMQEALLLFHNYMAAAQSLVDYSRVLYTHLYQANDLLPRYQAEIEARFFFTSAKSIRSRFTSNVATLSSS